MAALIVGEKNKSAEALHLQSLLWQTEKALGKILLSSLAAY